MTFQFLLNKDNITFNSTDEIYFEDAIIDITAVNVSVMINITNITISSPVSTISSSVIFNETENFNQSLISAYKMFNIIKDNTTALFSDIPTPFFENTNAFLYFMHLYVPDLNGCPAGSYIFDNNTCSLCAKNYYSVSINSVLCLACPTGTFATQIGSTICASDGSSSGVLTTTSPVVIVSSIIGAIFFIILIGMSGLFVHYRRTRKIKVHPKKSDVTMDVVIETMYTPVREFRAR